MPLADESVTGQPLLTEEVGPEGAVHQVGLGAVAVYARRIGEEDADVVEHRCLGDEVTV